ncbi:oligosaccharide flippase family protein [Pseudooceanicola nanhaiensis]|uniref:oligosaccharide flippase family protein n=1 Tax=Pseudooceanicola nanhaiensis TaxID=375761 RepID=UPI001CD1CE7F|nr:oligosaccharide flippase family protein [Pseudooceanicola nanhaiensis]MCA0921699.1 oligosaccharide flippase family protein [Pseudooceanicola nanhaiensis]
MTSAKGSAPSRRKGLIGSGVMTALERVISQACQLAIFIIAARLLSPAEFGAFALVSAIAIILLRVAEVGWAPYIMSWSGDSRVPRQVLALAILAGLVVGAAGVAIGYALPLAGLAVETGHLFSLFSFWVFLATISSAQKGVMIWESKLKASAICEITGELAGLVVAVTALLQGAGLFSLAFGRLAYQSTHLALSFVFTRMAPSLGMPKAERRDLWAFSARMFTSRLIINVRLYVATFIIGGFLGPAAVGYYRAAERLVGAVGEIVSVPTQVLAWNLFRQARDAHDGTTAGFQSAANIFFKILAAIALPVFMWVAVMAGDIVHGLLGEEWLPALHVVAILSAARAIALVGVVTEPVLTIAGEVGRLPWLTARLMIVTVALTLGAATTGGLLAVAWAQVAIAAITLVITLPMLRRYAGIDGLEVAGHCTRLLLPLAAAAAILLWEREADLLPQINPLLHAFVVALPSLVVYVALTLLVEPALRAPILARLRRRKGAA